MLRFLKIAVVAIPAVAVAMAPIEARANPMVAVGWLWAAGAGGLVAGWLTSPLWRPAPAYAAAPVVQADPYAQCERVQARYHGRWRQVMICD